MFIYANRNSFKLMLRTLLQRSNIRCAILDGDTTNTQMKKAKVHEAYLSKEYDVLITNITTGKDLPGDFICFYELTFDYKQMLGRGERGLHGVDLIVDFILTDSNYEADFFYNNVYIRGKMLEELCGKDLPELHQAIAQLKLLMKN